MDEIAVAAAVLFSTLMATGFWLIRWQYRKAEARVAAWARASHYDLLDKVLANPIGTGPKAARASNKQILYRVTVSDATTIRRALIKIGSPTLGILSDDFVVEWEHEPG
jgi:hypothetical protein